MATRRVGPASRAVQRQGPEGRGARPGLQRRDGRRLDRPRLQPGGDPVLRGRRRRPQVPRGRGAGLHPHAALLDRLQRDEQGRPGLRHHVHLGARGRSGRRPAGRAAGPSSPPTSWSWPAWRRSPGSTCSCCSAPTASARTPTSAWVLLVGIGWIVAMTYICYRGIEVSAWFQRILLTVEVVMLLVLLGDCAGPGRQREPPPGRSRRASAGCCPTHLSLSAFISGLILMLFIYWGWDTAVSINEETKDKTKTPGRAAIISTVILLITYALVIFSAPVVRRDRLVGYRPGQPRQPVRRAVGARAARLRRRRLRHRSCPGC